MQQPLARSAIKTAILWHDDTAAPQPLNELVTTLLAQQYRTLSFTEHAQAVEAVAAYDADVLLLYSPAASPQSYTICKTLREQLTTQHLPIVFVSSNNTQKACLEALRCGGSEYLTLPISAEECWLRLRPHLESYQLVRQLQAEHSNLSAKMGQYNHLLAQQEQLKALLTEENQALQKIAFLDGLTQVGNRRQFDRSAAQLWQTAYQQRSPLSLLMCDIDYFKRYNDTYGHLAGDDCLRSVAAALEAGTQRCVKQGDALVARYGGEEFAVLLPNIDAKAAQQVARSIQSAVAHEQIPHRASLVKPQVSISVGIHTLIPAYEHHTYERLIYGADKALYTAKLRGRDRIVATTLPEKAAERALTTVPEPLTTDYPHRLKAKSTRVPTRLSVHVA